MIFERCEKADRTSPGTGMYGWSKTAVYTGTGDDALDVTTTNADAKLMYGTGLFSCLQASLTISVA
jgi:hypothetical protein